MMTWNPEHPEPTPGSVVVLHGPTGTVAQRFFRDGLWRMAGKTDPLTWEQIVARSGVDTPIVLQQPPADDERGKFTVVGTWRRGPGTPTTLAVLAGPHEVSIPESATPLWTLVVDAYDTEEARAVAADRVGRMRMHAECVARGCDWSITAAPDTVARMAGRHASQGIDHEIRRTETIEVDA